MDTLVKNAFITSLYFLKFFMFFDVYQKKIGPTGPIKRETVEFSGTNRNNYFEMEDSSF